MHNIDINTLSQLTKVSVRTIRYYLAEGLLPPPEGRGPAASYGPGHRDRIRLIRRLQDAHQPLATIRTRLESLDDAAIAAALETVEPVSKPLSAQDYVRQVLAKTPTTQDVSSRVRAPDPTDTAHPHLPPRSTWERIPLHPDIELHVRRPLARADQRRLDELLDDARRLFTPKP